MIFGRKIVELPFKFQQKFSIKQNCGECALRQGLCSSTSKRNSINFPAELRTSVHKLTLPCDSPELPQHLAQLWGRVRSSGGLTAVPWSTWNIPPQPQRWTALIPNLPEALPILPPSQRPVSKHAGEGTVPHPEQGKKRPRWQAQRKTGSHWLHKATTKQINACFAARQVPLGKDSVVAGERLYSSLGLLLTVPLTALALLSILKPKAESSAEEHCQLWVIQHSVQFPPQLE